MQVMAQRIHGIGFAVKSGIRIGEHLRYVECSCLYFLRGAQLNHLFRVLRYKCILTLFLFFMAAAGRHYLKNATRAIKG